MDSGSALLSCVVGWELENNRIGTENEKGEEKKSYQSVTQKDGFVHWGKSRKQGEKLFSNQAFPLNCLVSLHWLSFFCLHWYNAP